MKWEDCNFLYPYTSQGPAACKLQPYEKGWMECNKEKCLLIKIYNREVINRE